MNKAVSFLLVILVLAALVSPAPLQALPRDASTPGTQTSPSLYAYLEVFLLVFATDLAGMFPPPFEPPAGVVER